jgi:hypothetical protein
VYNLHKALYALKQIVGSVIYLSNRISDTCLAESIISRYMNDHRKSRLTESKRIFIYIKGSMKLGLLFLNENKEEKIELVGYSYSNLCGDRSDRRNTSGYVFKFNNVAIS